MFGIGRPDGRGTRRISVKTGWRHIVPHIGSIDLQKLNGDTINALCAKLAVSGKKDGKTPLSPMSIHHVHATLHKALKDTVRWARLSRNPVDAADPPCTKGDGSREMKTWSAKQLKALFESTASNRLAALWHILAMTGIRRGEIVGLRWDPTMISLSVRLSRPADGQASPLESSPCRRAQ